MAFLEFDKTNTITRGKFEMDVVTNVVRTPGGTLVHLTVQQALVFAVHIPPNIPSQKRLATRAVNIFSNLNKIDPLPKKKCPSLTVDQFVATKAYLKHKKLPGWLKK